MLERILKFTCRLAVLLIALGSLYVIAFRRKSPLVLDTIRRALRATRPMQMKSSGAVGSYASVVRHVGRSSGRSYETPVQAVPTEDGFVIALPYGPKTDWMKNVVAAGGATIVRDGVAHVVERPEVVAMSAAEAFFPPKDQRAHRLFGIDQCLEVHLAPAA